MTGRPAAPLEVLYVDNHVLVVVKPSGIPVVPDESGDRSLLDEARDWVGHEFQKAGNVFLGVVHRLDRPVSGVLVFARTSKAAARLTNAFREGAVEKVYWGVSERCPQPDRGEVAQWLRKDRRRNRVECVAPDSRDSKRAVSRWRVIDRVGDERYLIELRPLTGRSHQLRVAAASLRAPLVGDLKYGAPHPLADKSIALHAHTIAFEHPVRREPLRYSCPPPPLDCWRFPSLSNGR